MPKLSTPTLVRLQTLNEWLVYARRAPKRAPLTPAQLLRSLRARMRMPQRELARRSGFTQSYIARLESGRLDAQFSTWTRVLDALHCDAVLLVRPRKQPGDALAEARVDGDERAPWPFRSKDLSVRVPGRRFLD